MKHKIEFFCYENDAPLEIQLEPECYLFQISPKTKLEFVAEAKENFKWAVRFDKGGIQLFPEDISYEYKITIYENGLLLEDWYKYANNK